MKRFLLFQALALAWIFVVAGQDFNAFFTDATLRLDYVFSGNAARQEISLDELCREPRWYGKRQRLAEVPVEGNGQVTVRDHHSGEVIYRHSFSTLFQEWLATPEARQVSRSFQNVFLVPMPKDTVDVTVSLTGSRRQVMATFTHQVAPSDILIRQVGYDHVTPFTTVQQAADTTRCIHIAFIAEGYQQGEMGTFRADVDTAVQAIFAHEPFRSMRSRFNVVAVEAPSMDSGTSEPGAGRWKNTALGSAFNTFYSDRYLTTLRLKRLHDLLAGTPYEHIVVLVNCKTYGGGGILNSYNLTSTHHQHYKPVVVHESGRFPREVGKTHRHQNPHPDTAQPGKAATNWALRGCRLQNERGLPSFPGLPHAHQQQPGVLRSVPPCHSASHRLLHSLNQAWKKDSGNRLG